MEKYRKFSEEMQSILPPKRSSLFIDGRGVAKPSSIHILNPPKSQFSS